MRTHSETALANGPARLLHIDASAFADMIGHNPQIGVCLIRMLVTNQHRIRQRLDEVLNAMAKSAPALPSLRHIRHAPALECRSLRPEPEPDVPAAVRTSRYRAARDERQIKCWRWTRRATTF